MAVRRDIQHFRGGRASARDKLNAMVDSVNRIQYDQEQPAQSIPMPRAASPMRPLSITAIGNDTLTGRYLYPDGAGGLEAGTVDITVLKPWTLRRTPFDGETVDGIDYTYSSAVEREATDGETTETQQVTPDYFVGAVIYVVAVNEDQADVIDANVDGRAWAVVPE